jgi:hypothetical protein
MKMRYAIVGSQGFVRLDLVRKFVAKLPNDAVVVSGGAVGPDTIAEESARSRGLTTKVIPAKWNELGKGAGMARNPAIIGQADKVVAFWDGKSPGTRNAISLARKAGKPLLIIWEDGTTRREEPGQQLQLW